MHGYELERVIGRGSAGIVHLARRRDDPLGPPLALKHLTLTGGRGDEAAVARLRREAAALRALADDGVVPIIELVDDGVDLWLATEFVDGASLDAVLPVDVAAALVVVEQLARTLDAVHGEGIVHRDIKPANVLVDRSGRVRLVDFGLARFVSDSQHVRAGGGVRTETATVLGTPRYLAPEALDGTTSPAADVYSLGVVAYELLTGAPPFTETDIATVMAAHHDRVPPDPRARRADLGEATASALLAALAKRPEERPPSATDFARRLTDAADSGAPWRERGRAALAAAVTTAAAARLAAGETLTDEERGRAALPAARVPVFRGRRLRRVQWAIAAFLAAAVVGFVITRV